MEPGTNEPVRPRQLARSLECSEGTAELPSHPKAHDCPLDGGTKTVMSAWEAGMEKRWPHQRTKNKFGLGIYLRALNRARETSIKG